MLDVLKSLYGQAFTFYDKTLPNPEDFFWLEANNKVSFGIRKTAVTDRELQLLKLQFNPVDPHNFTESPEQMAWSQLLFHNVNIEENDRYLFFPSYPLYVNFKQLPNDLTAFEEAMTALFSEPPIILWKEKLAILILKNADDLTLASEIIDLMASDLFIDVTVLTQTVFYDKASSHKAFKLHTELFSLSQNVYPRKRLFSLDYLIPLYLVHKSSDLSTDILFKKVKQTLLEGGNELEETLLTFLINNMNVSTAAKALYIHRNSLQYRLEKFTEKTGLDPKNFEDAIVIYIAILKERLDFIVTNSQDNA